MTTHLTRCGVVLVALLAFNCETHGRGFGGFRGGSFGGYRGGSFGGYRGGSFGGYRGGSFGGYRGGSGGYSSYRGGSFGGFSGASERSGSAGRWGDRGYAGGSYDRSYTGPRGGSYSAEGTRGLAYGPRGVAAGGTRDVTATGPEGRTYSGERQGGFAAGDRGAVAGGSRWATVSPGNYHFASDAGLSHYAGVAAGGVGHSTALWSNSAMADRAVGVRRGFSYGYAFNPGWYTLHPGCWAAAGWAAGAAWAEPAWSSVATFIDLPSAPVYYDYGSNVVYQNNNVYVDGTDAGTAAQYTQQAADIAAQGQAANPAATDKWQSLGVFALVQGDETSSNNMFQLAVDVNGTIRGNYYDGLMDSATPVYGSIDKRTQRAAWTIGDKKTTVFETGAFNLTKDQTPVLVHFGKDRTQQWLLVRMPKPKGAN